MNLAHLQPTEQAARLSGNNEAAALYIRYEEYERFRADYLDLQVIRESYLKSEGMLKGYMERNFEFKRQLVWTTKALRVFQLCTGISLGIIGYFVKHVVFG